MSGEVFLKRALELALRGGGAVCTNPLVGAVVESKGIVLGEGYHTGYGKPHAEVEAIRSVPAHLSGLLQGSTLYVTLEPCNHHGKTPPCTELILKTGIARVVVGCIDPNPLVAGKGIAYLRARGIDVQIAAGRVAQAALDLIRPFRVNILEQQPYVLLKWAQTADGYMALPGVQRWISAPLTQRLTHLWRTHCDAIMVGSGTVLTDNPALTARFGATKQPIRIVLDPHGQLDRRYRVFDDAARTILVSPCAADMPAHVEVWFYDTRHPDGWLTLMTRLYQEQVGMLMVEGGVSVLNFILKHNLWHEARIIKSKAIWGEGMRAPITQGAVQQSFSFGDDDIMVCHRG